MPDKEVQALVMDASKLVYAEEKGTASNSGYSTHGKNEEKLTEDKEEDVVEKVRENEEQQESIGEQGNGSADTCRASKERSKYVLKRVEQVRCAKASDPLEHLSDYIRSRTPTRACIGRPTVSGGNRSENVNHMEQQTWESIPVITADERRNNMLKWLEETLEKYRDPKEAAEIVLDAIERILSFKISANNKTTNQVLTSADFCKSGTVDNQSCEKRFTPTVFMSVYGRRSRRRNRKVTMDQVLNEGYYPPLTKSFAQFITSKIEDWRLIKKVYQRLNSKGFIRINKLIFIARKIIKDNFGEGMVNWIFYQVRPRVHQAALVLMHYFLRLYDNKLTLHNAVLMRHKSMLTTCKNIKETETAVIREDKEEQSQRNIKEHFKPSYARMTVSFNRKITERKLKEESHCNIVRKRRECVSDNGLVSKNIKRPSFSTMKGGSASTNKINTLRQELKSCKKEELIKKHIKNEVKSGGSSTATARTANRGKTTSVSKPKDISTTKESLLDSIPDQPIQNEEESEGKIEPYLMKLLKAFNLQDRLKDNQDSLEEMDTVISQQSILSPEEEEEEDLRIKSSLNKCSGSVSPLKTAVFMMVTISILTSIGLYVVITKGLPYDVSCATANLSNLLGSFKTKTLSLFNQI